MRTSKPERTDNQINRKLILKYLRKPRTANEVIEMIFKSDVRTNKINDRSWKFYVHLNKLFFPMKKDGELKEVGTKIGPTNRTEKIWLKN